MGYAYPTIIQGSDGDQFGDQVTPLFPVGQKLELPDNRIFRYAEMGNTIGVANKLYQSEVPLAGWLREEILGNGLYGDNHVGLQNTSQAVIVNEFAEGYFMFEAAADLGHIYPVAENDILASGTPGTGADACRFKPGVFLQFEVLDAGGNVFHIFKNPWKDIIIKPASDQTALVVGIPPSIIVGNDWGWCQTRGIASCLVAGTLIIGQECRADDAVAGAVAEMDYDDTGNDSNGPVGRVVEVAPSADFGLINLTLD